MMIHEAISGFKTRTQAKSESAKITKAMCTDVISRTDILFRTDIETSQCCPITIAQHKHILVRCRHAMPNSVM